MIVSILNCWCARLLAFVLLMSSALADEIVPVLQTRTETYNNVSLVSRTGTHVFIRHSRGVATLKLAELPQETLVGLGVLTQEEVAAAAVKSSSSSNLVRALAPVSAIAQSLPASLNAKAPAGLKLPADPNKFILVAVGIMVLIHLAFSYCAMLICRKAGMDPGIMVWLPVLQAHSLIRAAGMSGWWFPACIIPGLNIVALVLWAINIAKVRGKGILTSIMLILPVANLVAFLYLAFSGGSAVEDDEEDGRPLRLSPLPM